MRRPLLALLLALGAACARDREPPAYHVTIDVTPSVHALASDDMFESDEAVERLAALGADVLPVLEEALHREPVPVRVGIVEVLSRLRTPECVPLLLRVAAEDAEADVRYEALQELGAGADPRARAGVEAALDDPAPKVRLAAAKGCAKLCTSPAALARLVRIAVADQPFPNAVWARASLVRMLAEKDGALAAQARAAIEEGARPVLGGTAPLEERARAGLLLAELGDAAGAAALAEAAAAPEANLQLRLYAAWALGRVGGAGEVARLTAMLEDPQRALTGYAADTLRRLGERGVPGAAEALGAHGGPLPAQPLPPPGP